MVRHVKTTFDIDDSVMRRLREEAERRGTTMSTLIEAGLRCLLAAPEVVGAPEALPPLPSWNGGEELVDISDRDALCRAMEEPSGHAGACGVTGGPDAARGNRCTP